MSQMIDPNEKPSIDQALAHFGVKGMRWGVRKSQDGGSGGGSAKAPSRNRQIKKARVAVSAKVNAINSHTDKINAAVDAGASNQKLRSLAKEHENLIKDWKKDPRRADAVRMTTGEKAATIIISGPFAAIPIAGTALISRQITKNQAKNK